MVGKNAAKAQGKLPGYFATKPLFGAVIRLRKLAGERDKDMELIELSLRYFAEAATKCNHVKDFVDEAAHDLRVRVGASTSDEILRAGARVYVVHVHATADAFFRELISEYRTYKRISDAQWKWKESRNGGPLDPMQQLIANLPDHARKTVMAAPEFELLDYYRKVRNELIHSIGGRVSQTSLSCVETHREYFTKTYRRGTAPNAPDSLDFDDFLLYARALKYFAELINDACDLQVDEIVDRVFQSEVELVIGSQRKLHDDRLRRAHLLGYFRSHFGAECPIHAVQFVESVMIHLNQIPGRVARGRMRNDGDRSLRAWLQSKAIT